MGTFNMSDSSGAYVGGAVDVTGSFIINSETGLGIGSFSSATPFFGNLWNAHDVAIQLNGDGTAELNMFLSQPVIFVLINHLLFNSWIFGCLYITAGLQL